MLKIKILALTCLLATAPLLAHASSPTANQIDICQELGLCPPAPPPDSQSTTPSTVSDFLWNLAENAWDWHSLTDALAWANFPYGEKLIWVGRVPMGYGDALATADRGDYFALTATPTNRPNGQPQTWSLFIIHQGRVRLLTCGSGDAVAPFPPFSVPSRGEW